MIHSHPSRPIPSHPVPNEAVTVTSHKAIEGWDRWRGQKGDTRELQGNYLWGMAAVGGADKTGGRNEVEIVGNKV